MEKESESEIGKNRLLERCPVYVSPCEIQRSR
jgi:hypothetical protein